MAGEGLNGKTGEYVRWVLALALAGLVSYFTSIGAVQTRVAIAESKIEQIREDLKEIKADVKLLLQAVNR
jgi:hypothetical protein